MAKKSKQLTAKRESFAAAADAVIKSGVAMREMKAWVKEAKEALTAYSKAIPTIRTN